MKVEFYVYLTIKFIFWLLSDCDLTLKYYSFIINYKSYYENKVIWVTGASSGIGQQLAKDLSNIKGVKLILSSRNINGLNETVQLCNNNKESIKLLQLDLEDIDSLSNKVLEANKLFENGIDILINNGGISQRSYCVDTDFEVDKKIIKVDYLSAIILSKTLLKIRLNEKKLLHLINISSLAGKIGGILRTSYCGAKFALIGFMDGLRMENSPELKVCNICPGSVQTNIAKNALNHDGTKFQKLYPNIENGMKKERCSKLILISAAADLEEVWLFGSNLEKFASYFQQYAPGIFRKFSKKNAATTRRIYAERILNFDNEKKDS